MPEPTGVAVTRAAEDAAPLAAALEALGLHAVLTPLLHFVPLAVTTLAARLDGSVSYDWLACTSRHAVTALGEAMARRGLAPSALPVQRIAAVGTGTARALESLGLHVDLVPAHADAEHLAHALEDGGRVAQGEGASAGGTGRAGPRLLFPRAVEARDTLPSLLREAGWLVDDVPCYETCAFAPGGVRLDEALMGGEVAAVTLASGSAARAFATMIPASRRAMARLVSIGPTTTAAAGAAGLAVAAEAPTATMEALAEATRRILSAPYSHA